MSAGSKQTHIASHLSSEKFNVGTLCAHGAVAITLVPAPKAPEPHKHSGSELLMIGARGASRAFARKEKPAGECGFSLVPRYVIEIYPRIGALIIHE